MVALVAIVAVGLLAGGAALVKFGPGVSSPVKTVPGPTIEPRGRLQRPGMEEHPSRDARIEIEVRGEMRRER